MRRRYDAEVTAAITGQAALWVAMVLALAAVATGRRFLLVWSAVAVLASTAVLTFALLTGDFSLAYVATTTSLSTPWPYRIAALWGGMDGSMLFYTLLTTTVAAWGLRRGAETRVGAGVALGFMAVTMFFANPFYTPDIPAVDGEGLLAILQHPAMIYHPPILYLGLVVLVVPFAMTVTPDSRREGRREWLRDVRPWAHLSWSLLAFGMVFGANWAYVELGWGGFWAWDPVENTALMPWLALTVLLHASRIEQATGRMRRWNVMFAGLPFALSVMGVYLTRSGATGSIHSFAEDPVVGRILLGATVVVALVVALVAWRSQRGETWGEMVLDDDGWLAINSMLLTAGLVFVTAGSAYPAFRSVFAGEQVVVDSRFFVLTMLPIAILVAVGLALSLGAPLSAYLLAVAVAGGVGLLAAGFRPGLTLLAVAIATVVWIVVPWAKRQPRRRLLVAHVAHLGMALLLVGVAASSLGDEFEGSMRPGDIITVGGHEIVLTEVVTGEADRYVYVRAVFDVDGRPVTPEIRGYESQDLPVAEPALVSRPSGDVIVAISLLFPDGETVAVSVFLRPLVWLVWTGAGLIALAGLLALSGRGGGAGVRRRSARAGRLPEGTTSGTPSR